MTNTFALLVPCYNAEKFVLRFLKNLHQLNIPFNEVIFYDDGSTDRTVELLRANGQKVIKGQTNKGPSVARNILADNTKCNWFHFHDIDDFLAPNYLQEVSQYALDGIDVVLCNVDWLNEDNSEILIKWRYSNEAIRSDSVAYTITHPVGGINGLYKKTAFIKINGFNENIRVWEDGDLHVRLAENGAVFHIVEKVLSYSTRLSTSLSSDQSNAWKTRLGLLEIYSMRHKGKSIQMATGLEAQKTASELIKCKEFDAAKRALLLSEECGVKVPNSLNPLWMIMKRVLPIKQRVYLRIFQLKQAFS